MSIKVLLRSTLLLLLVTACARSKTPLSTPDGDSSVSVSQQQDWAGVERAEQVAKGLAHTDKCANAGECRVAPVGHKACGGPRYYLVYCAASTDTVALARALAEVARLEEAYNKKWQVMSTCEFRLPPTARVSGGYCQEAASR